MQKLCYCSQRCYATSKHWIALLPRRHIIWVKVVIYDSTTHLKAKAVFTANIFFEQMKNKGLLQEQSHSSRCLRMQDSYKIFHRMFLLFDDYFRIYEANLCLKLKMSGVFLKPFYPQISVWKKILKNNLFGRNMHN